METAIAEYEVRKGILLFEPSNEVANYLNMPQRELRLLTADEAGEAGTLVSIYASHVQKVYNQELAKVNWADSLIRRMMAEDYKQGSRHSAEERKLSLLNKNEFARKLDELRTWAQLSVDRLSFQAGRIESIAKSFISLQQSKRTNGRH